MKRVHLTIVGILFVFIGFAQVNKDAKMHQFVNTLMSKMTLEEKLGQLNLPASSDFVTGAVSSSDIADKVKAGKVGGVFNIRSVTKIKELQQYAVNNSRLHIPLLFGMDVIHGYKTIFPIPLGMSATWDMELIKKSASIAASEASADGIQWTFSPMVDLTRDPRWGRVSEGNGEDAFLSSAIAKAMVHGYQGDDLSAPNTILSCVKHYALYGAAEGGRDYNTTDMSRVRMYNEYFPPYKAAVDAGVASVMMSFNEVDGIPASGNKWLVDDVLRKQWKFSGFVVSDYTGIPEMTNHGVGDAQTVNAMSMNAGVDMDMVGEGFLNTMKKSLQEGKVTLAQINKACERILISKYQLGLFDDPYRYCNEQRSATEVFTAANRAEARRIAAQSFVLLKNNNVLPIAAGKKIALVGPLANAKENMTGTWSVGADNSKSISLLKGLTDAVGNNGKVVYAVGSNLEDDLELQKRQTLFEKDIARDNRSAEEMIQEALSISADADVIVAALGEGAESSGESASKSNIDIPEAQKRLLKALVATGKPVVLVLFNGRPLTLNWENENVPAILDVWFAGSEAGDAIADALLGKVNPSGKLSMSFPQNVGQIPLYYNHKNTGRPLTGKWFSKFQSNYIDVSNEPLYPFGFGLSYTSFEYGAMQVSLNQLKGNQKLKVTIPVKNTGKYAGKEVVQLYIRDEVGTITRPVKELKGFEKIELAAGETKEVVFEITTDLLKFYNSDLKFDWESGDFQIMVGPNSRDVKAVKVNWVK
ncbi:MAG: beta-glucosidase BglX [Chitinophagaceae bacterium]|jgi:beta-glucosidase|nr:beta-glucosidase BglX [Chitinophagaceae bacterium]MCF8421732.1 beta-glucosidase BglX [Chitinophagaceae bacterium]